MTFKGTERYTLIAEIGRGAFGCVYEAQDEEKNRRVALKVLERTSPDALYRFKQEFRNLSGIRHPNLVSLYDLECHDDFWFFSMELVRGRPLLEHAASARTRTQKSLTSDLLRPLRPPKFEPRSHYETRVLFRQLAEALIALHESGRVHRDVKPSNVLVTEVGRVVLLDFGLVFLLASASDAEASAFVGTPGYMSPEQLSAEPATAASDWYSLGVLMFQALTGSMPFRAETIVDLLTTQLERDPPRPSELTAGVPGDLDDLCFDLLSRDPDRRPAGADVRARLGGSSFTYWLPAYRTRSAVPAAPFVGRSDALATLAAEQQAALDGTRVVLLHGASGSGKTTLLNRFFDLQRQAGAALLVLSRCVPNDFVAFNALDDVIDSMARHLEALPYDEQRDLVPDDIAFLSRLFPVLDRSDAVAQRTKLLAQRRGLRDRAAAPLKTLLRNLARREPTIIAIDNAQWGDLDSAEMLVEALSGDDAPPLLVIVAYTSDDAPSSLFLRRLRHADATFTELELGPMSDEELRALIRPAAVSASVLDAAVAESAGNPFLAMEFALGLRDHVVQSGSLTLSNVLWSRLAALPSESRGIVEVLAVAGQPLTPEVAAAIAGVDRVESELIVPLRELRFIRSRFTGYIEEIELYHDFIRANVLSAIPSDRLKAVHEAVARELESGAMDEPAVIAGHYAAAERYEAAARHFDIAAAKARRSGADQRAAAFEENAAEMQRKHAVSRATDSGEPSVSGAAVLDPQSRRA